MTHVLDCAWVCWGFSQGQGQRTVAVQPLIIFHLHKIPYTDNDSNCDWHKSAHAKTLSEILHSVDWCIGIFEKKPMADTVDDIYLDTLQYHSLS